MIKHAWTVVCQKVMVDKESNNMSIDVIEEIQFEGVAPPPEAQEAPGLLIPYPITIASLWYRSDLEQPVRANAQLKIKAPNDDLLARLEMNVDLSQNPRCRTICKMATLPIPKGKETVLRFIMELEVDGEFKKVAEMPLVISCTWAEETQILPPS